MNEATTNLTRAGTANPKPWLLNTAKELGYLETEDGATFASHERKRLLRHYAKLAEETVLSEAIIRGTKSVITSMSNRTRS